MAAVPPAQGKIVGISGCVRQIRDHTYHAANHRYVHAVAEVTGATPLLIPPLGSSLDIADLVPRLDGLVLTGSASNVMPQHYGGPPSRPDTNHDAARDATILPLIAAALEAALPLFAICRGFQELNVACGGTLHQHLEEVVGHRDHLTDREQPLEERFAPSHEVALVPGGQLAGLLGRPRLEVNSAHAQGVDRLGPGLELEATAEDGTAEAARVRDARAFALGVQWHPEFLTHIPEQRALFAAFGEAVATRG
ncbi:MAG TPA: gamma-glutamyl-gamma-aminobutyrate hydrolase family protein [Alphaproteobacteria bacterium]|jgi:putative glutamine amidotransferase|nr:gamma-glutamyl-gamma-aminobutyrate hydrolase family protein [Alphaproteobacteria bacterium]HJM49387.1 gamma-glutamyl-gamma-aminobutyrate hydrolase family protein [Alphaproteobacteria bacterium]